MCACARACSCACVKHKRTQCSFVCLHAFTNYFTAWCIEHIFSVFTANLPDKEEQSYPSLWLKEILNSLIFLLI